MPVRGASALSGPETALVEPAQRGGAPREDRGMDPRRLTAEDVQDRLRVRSAARARALRRRNAARFELVAAASPHLLRPSELVSA